MKLHPEDPRLTAYLLGELSADETAAVERAVAADPALLIALQELENIQRLLGNTLAPDTGTLLPRQREHILQAARRADEAERAVALAPPRSRIRPFLVPLATAASIGLGIFILSQLPHGKPSTVKSPPSAEKTDGFPLEVALLPAPGPADSSGAQGGDARPAASSDLAKSAAARDSILRETGDLFLRKVSERLAAAPPPSADKLPALHPRGSVSAAEHPTLALPVHAGRSSLGWITRSIREDKQRPPANAVRVEEVLNEFALRPAGAAAVAQGVTLSTEALACPWKPSATLLVVSFRGASDEAREVAATFTADPAAVRRYRLLGFAPVAGLGAGPLPTRLPARAITSLVLEIEPATATGGLGRIEWSVNGQSAAAVPLGRQGDAEPSDDARFAALVCTYTQWLAGNPAGLVDADLVAAIARETASEAMPADRVDFLNLIDQTLDIR